MRGWVLFDAECHWCAGLAARFMPLLHRHRFALLPLQSPGVAPFLGVGGDDLLSEMRLVMLNAAKPKPEVTAVYGGADALLEIARRIWWARPLSALPQIPGATSALRKAYGWVAQRRHCLAGACKVRTGSDRPCRTTLKWMWALMPVTAALILGPFLPAWIWMWLIVLGLFVGAKWLTLAPLLAEPQSGTTADEGEPFGVRREPQTFSADTALATAAQKRRLLGYAFFWPGMDARAFCSEGSVPVPPIYEWLVAFGKMLFGAALTWFVAARLLPAHPLVAGWVGMFGLVFVLHFGLFHLLSLLWRKLGINAPPIMCSPGTATGLSQFWGGRWNRAFHDLMHGHLFVLLARRLGACGALLLTFVISGLLHELVISVPARGGYGLPTLYFVIQGLGLVLERSRVGKHLRLGTGARGWAFVALVAGLPAYWLFPPPFIRAVILPMLQAIGAT